MGELATLASSNENKLRELRHALAGWTIELLGADEYPPESGETYYENARRKAEFARTRVTDRWVLGEDSGVEIEGLGGGPGVLSARWAAGREAERALEELQGVQGDARRARYVCELVAISPDGTEYRGAGTLEGRIAGKMSGTEGFGFDPVFVPDGEERTVADLGNEWKQDNSHRARAARALLASIMPLVNSVNLFTAEDAGGRVDVAQMTGSTETLMFIYDLAPGESSSPYHYEYEEEWLLVVDGTVVVRTPDGEHTLERGELVRFPPGPDGAHKVMNRSDAPARTLLFSNARTPAVSVYPDSDTIGVWPGDEANDLVFERRTAVPWAHGEAGWDKAT